jgi:hypothetical protein
MDSVGVYSAQWQGSTVLSFLCDVFQVVATLQVIEGFDAIPS